MKGELTIDNWDEVVVQADFCSGWLPLRANVVARAEQEGLLAALSRQFYSAQAMIDVVSSSVVTFNDERMSFVRPSDWSVHARYHLALCDQPTEILRCWKALSVDGRLVAVFRSCPAAALQLRQHGWMGLLGETGYSVLVADKPVNETLMLSDRVSQLTLL